MITVQHFYCTHPYTGIEWNLSWRITKHYDPTPTKASTKTSLFGVHFFFFFMAAMSRLNQKEMFVLKEFISQKEIFLKVFWEHVAAVE